MTDTIKDPLEKRIETAQQRNGRRLAEQAARARDNMAGFVGSHPFASLAAAVGAGMVLGVFFPRAAGAKLGRKAGTIATLAAELGLAYSRNALKSAQQAGHAGREQLEEIGESIVDSTAGLRHEIGRLAEEAALNAREAGRTVGERASSVADKIGSRMRH